MRGVSLCMPVVPSNVPSPIVLCAFLFIAVRNNNNKKRLSDSSGLGQNEPVKHLVLVPAALQPDGQNQFKAQNTRASQ